MSAKLDAICVSDMCVDLILTGRVRPRFGQAEQVADDYTVELGGSANIFAGQFIKLGGRAGVIGAAGNDPFGRLAIERLDGLGVDISRVRRRADIKTGLGLALVDADDRAILTCPGTIDALRPQDLTGDLLSAARHWHVASLFLLKGLRSGWADWLPRLRRRGVTTSLDTGWDPADRWDGVRELLPDVDVFLPNEAEARAITGEPDLRAAGAALASDGPLVVIKRGACGAAVFDREGCRFFDAPESEQPVVDTIGAGDNFDAGFLRAWQLGYPTDDCVRWAQRCGASSLAAAGGFAAQCKERIHEPEDIAVDAPARTPGAVGG